MRVLIVEDEMPAVERLQTLLREYDTGIQVAATLDSVVDTVEWLKNNPHPDLILMDIHLSDGHSFDIFSRYPY